mgnify:CR=1 FL=1
MSLVAQLSALATRIGNEIKGLIRPDHPGLARAWVNFGYVNGSVQLRAAYNVASVTRLAAGRYRIQFETAMPDAKYCWVATGRSNAILMAESIRENAFELRRFKRAERQRTGSKSIKRGTEIPIAGLVPNVTLKRRFDLEGAVRGQLSVLARAIEKQLNKI